MMDRHTGQRMERAAWLYQAIADVLETRRGERVMRPEYGTRLHELVDRPMTRALVAEVAGVASDGLAESGVPVDVEHVEVSAAPGRLAVVAHCRASDGTPIVVEVDAVRGVQWR